MFKELIVSKKINLFLISNKKKNLIILQKLNFFSFFFIQLIEVNLNFRVFIFYNLKKLNLKNLNLFFFS
jgi:hypothetical protein